MTLGADIYYGHGAGWGDENHAETIFNNCTALEKVTILGAGTVKQRFIEIEKGLPDTMCLGCTSLKEVIIKCDDLQYVGKVNESTNTETFPANGTTLVQYDNKITYYIYEGSTTEKTLRNAGYLKNATDETEANYVYIPDLTALETAIASANDIDTSKYTEESVSALTEALEAGKAVLENALENIAEVTQEDIDNAAQAINDAISGLEEKPVDNPSNPSDPSETQPTTNKTTAKTPTTTKTPTKTTRSTAQVKKDKTAAKKAMKQAKITKLTAKSKAKKKVAVSWKKVKKAVGYQVQVSAKKNFKKVIFNKLVSKNKLIVKNSKIKSKKTYYIRVRAYSTYNDANGKAQKVYSKWNKKIRKVKTK